jgi:hypothetical protein
MKLANIRAGMAGGETQMECGWGINVCSSRAAFRLEYARETGEVYEVRYMCPRHAAWALELDGRVAIVRVTPISCRVQDEQGR